MVTMDADAARRLTERIRLTAQTFAESRDRLMELVGEAKAGNAHLALGYDSWTAYLADVLGEEPLRLARDDRRELVGALSAEGMSTRAIAPIVGVNHSTVVRDLPTGANAPVGRVMSRDGRERPSRAQPRQIEAAPEPPVNTRATLRADIRSLRHEILSLPIAAMRRTSDVDRQPLVKDLTKMRDHLNRALDALQ